MLSTKWFYAFVCVCLLFSTTTSSFAAIGAGFDVIIGSKNTRQFNWIGLMDEVRISGIARDAEVLSPNLAAPQAVEFTAVSLPIRWGQLKQ